MLRRPSLFLVTCAALGAAPGCEREAPPGAQPARVTSVAAQPGKPRAAAGAEASVERRCPGPLAPPALTAVSEPPAFPPDFKGTWFAATSLSAGVYTEPRFEATKLGYLRNGGRVPVESEPTSKKNCTRGWYKLLSGGFICGNLGTTDMSHPEVKFATKPPNLAEVLPYRTLATRRTARRSTARSPSREQMERYEPYLVKPRDPPPATSGAKPASDAVSAASKVAPGPAPALNTPAAATPVAAAAGEPQPPPPTAATGAAAAAIADGGLITAAAAQDPAPETPWWQREDAKDRLHEVKLEQLEQDSDDVLAKRMVTGFYVAVDRTFSWAGRSFYKTTKGLVAPSDRFWQTAGPKFKGVVLEGSELKLPLAWAVGGRKSVGTYNIDPATKQLSNAKTYERFEPIALSEETQEVGKNTYQKLVDGSWIKQSQVRITKPSALPAGLQPGERWIDVNLKSQTLVAYIGDKPVFATLVSTGKESKDKDKDHRTPPGEFRIREKHITTTMDGDGSAAGDLAVQHRGRAVRDVLSPVFRAPRRVLALELRHADEPRLREPVAARRQVPLLLRDAGDSCGLPRFVGDRARPGHSRRHPRMNGADWPASVRVDFGTIRHAAWLPIRWI